MKPKKPVDEKKAPVAKQPVKKVEEKKMVPKVKKVEKQPDGVKYGLKKSVLKGWTFDSLEICFGVTKEELIKANPELKKHGLRYGFDIEIPVHYLEYTVKKDDTLPEIAQKYKITVTRLENTNFNLA